MRTPFTIFVAAIAVLAALMVTITFMAAVQTEGDQQTNPAGNATWSALAIKEIPAEKRAIYERAAAAYKLDGPFVLAGVGRVETTHGTSKLPGVKSGVNEYGCCAGPFQFMVSRNAGCRTSCYADPTKGTWEAYGVDANGDGKANVYDFEDAAFGAAHYLSANGAPKDWKGALFVYNRSSAYYADVMEWAGKYRSVGTGGDLLLDLGMTRGQVASHPKLSVQNPAARTDLLTVADERLVVLLGSILTSGHAIELSVVKTGHSQFTASGNVSNHWAGRAMDIAMVDGKRCNPYTASDPCGQLAISMGRIQGAYRPTELIASFDPDGPGPAWADPAGHSDHVHAGFNA